MIKKDEWAKIIMLFAFLSIISWLIGYWFALQLNYPFGSIIFLIVVFLIAWCISSNVKYEEKKLNNAYTILKEIEKEKGK